MYQKPMKDSFEKADEKEITHVTISQAFYLFMDCRFIKYHESLNIRWQAFRDEELLQLLP